MNLADLRNALRQRLDDLALPYLWADTELNAYLNEAQQESCERAHLIYDQTSAVTQITVVANTALYSLDSSILAVDRVDLVSKNYALGRLNQPGLDNYAEGIPSYEDWDYGTLPSFGNRWETRTGVPRGFIEEVGSIRLFPIPNANDSLQLSVWRGAAQLVADTDIPQIPARYHLRMIDWAIYLAYLKRDTSAFDPAKMVAADASFTRHFGEKRDAEQQRKLQIKRVPIVRSCW